MHSFLGSFLGDDATGGSADPNSPVIALTNPSSPLPTVPPTPLATSDAQPVPTTPSSPMQFSAPEPLAVVDPGLPPPTVLAPVVVAPAPSFFAQHKAMVIGAGLLAAYLMFNKGGSTKAAAPAKHRRKSRYTGRRKFHHRRR